MLRFSLLFLSVLLVLHFNLVYAQHDSARSLYDLKFSSTKALRPRGDRPPSSPPSSSREPGSSSSGSKILALLKGKTPAGPTRQEKKELMKKNPVTLVMQIHGPATVKGWEGKKGTVLPKVPTGKMLNLELVHPKSVMANVDHEGKESETYAFAAGKVTRSAAQVQDEEYKEMLRKISKKRLANVWLKKKASEDIQSPIYGASSFLGLGKIAVAAQNHDSGSESDGSISSK